MSTHVRDEIAEDIVRLLHILHIMCLEGVLALVLRATIDVHEIPLVHGHGVKDRARCREGHSVMCEHGVPAYTH